MSNNNKNKKSLVRGFCVTLFLGIVLIIAAVISNQFPDEVNKDDFRFEEEKGIHTTGAG